MRTKALTPAGPEVTVIGLGTSPLGGNVEAYGYDVSAEDAAATLSALLDSSISFLDTSNEYSGGEAERRIGDAIRRADGAASSIVIATKADPLAGGRDLSGDRVRASFAESLDRLGVEQIGLYHLHDPERFPFEDITAPGGALDALRSLKADGLVRSIGVAGGNVAELHRYLDLGVLDVLLNHNQYNLIDRSADGLIDHAVEAGVSFINAAPYASGLLAKPGSARARFQYHEASESEVQQAEWLRSASARFGVPLAALSLQFSTRDPRIVSTIVGASRPERVRELEINEEWDIPQELWDLVAERCS